MCPHVKTHVFDRNTRDVCVPTFRRDTRAWHGVYPYHHRGGQHKQCFCNDTILHRLHAYHVRFGCRVFLQCDRNKIPHPQPVRCRDSAGFGDVRTQWCALSITIHLWHVRRIFSYAQIILDEPGPARSPTILRHAQPNVRSTRNIHVSSCKNSCVHTLISMCPHASLHVSLFKNACIPIIYFCTGRVANVNGARGEVLFGVRHDRVLHKSMLCTICMRCTRDEFNGWPGRN